ncbi:MAG: glycoside hydrolase 43 family protein [Lachnospiraceae bacterium]|nr:glycoside hydrolase 43 family protein [Lachnospiraceae bacterium]
MEHFSSENREGYYQNPVIYSDYSDPDAIRVGNDYYLTASSFTNTPGLPILHSLDLVHWKLTGYALENVPGDRYKKPMHGCGVWAPAIRYHNGYFYIYFPMPDEGIFVTRSKSIHGPWSEPLNIMPGAGHIDPCPFWDEDGKAYLVYGVAKSRIGYKSVLYISELSGDGMAIIGKEIKVFDGNHNGQNTVEGPKLYKRNRYYYIFAPAGGVKTGWQLVLRSADIYGPYEYRIVMKQGSTGINGPHQGAWVDTVSGEDWFIHFQDVYAAGRIVHLQPMHWEDDWPVIGNEISDGCGEPVITYKYPHTLMQGRCDDWTPDTSDHFENGRPNTAWQWNANHKGEWIEAHGGSGLEMTTVETDPSIPIGDYPNILMQKWPGPEFSIETVIDISELKENNRAGIISMGMDYGVLEFQRNKEEIAVNFIRGHQVFGRILVDRTDQKSEYIGKIELENAHRIRVIQKVIRKGLRDLSESEKNFPREEISFAFAVSDKEEIEAGTIESHPGRWVGSKNGFYAVADRGFEKGVLKVISVSYKK